MAYHQGRLVAIVSHQSVRAVYHHTFRCVSKMLSQWWYTTVSTVDDIHGVAVMICNSLQNWLYTMLRIDFNKNMCYSFVEKGVILCLRTIWLFIQNNSQLILHCCVKNIKAPSNSIFQIQKSSSSVYANIREANYGQSKADMLSKFEIALKECSETEGWLQLLFNTNAIDEDTYKKHRNLCGRIRRMLISSCKTLKKDLIFN